MLWPADISVHSSGGGNVCSLSGRVKYKQDRTISNERTQLESVQTPQTLFWRRRGWFSTCLRCRKGKGKVWSPRHKPVRDTRKEKHKRFQSKVVANTEHSVCASLQTQKTSNLQFLLYGFHFVLYHVHLIRHYLRFTPCSSFALSLSFLPLFLFVSFCFSFISFFIFIKFISHTWTFKQLFSFTVFLPLFLHFLS